MGGTTVAAPTRLQILEDALKWARTVGAVKNGSNIFEVEFDAALKEKFDLYEEPSGRLEADSTDVAHFEELRDKVCGVCLAGAVYLAHIHRGIPLYGGERPVEPFDELTPFASQARCELGIESAELFSEAITEGGDAYIVRTLELAVEAERGA